MHAFGENPEFSFDSLPDAPPEGERWSSWDGATHGPKPRPDWVITALAAVEADLGVLKTGKEADVHVVRRWVPDGTDHPALDTWMAAKRYRTSEHRMFHRDAGYQEGRRVRRSREMRAMARRTEFGRELLAGQWASAEFEALGRLWELGLPVPAEVKRMYVVPHAQRAGHARTMLRHLEVTAAERGATHMILETGAPQIAAIALYTSSGYEPVPSFGHYRWSPTNRCFAKPLTGVVADT